MHELCVHCDHEDTKAENDEFCMIGYPRNSPNRCQDNKLAEGKICTELGKKQGQVKCASGLGIGSLTLPRGLNNPSGRLKLPLQTCPVSSKIHISATSIKQFTKMHIRLLSHCNRTSRAIEFPCLDTKVETQSR